MRLLNFYDWLENKTLIELDLGQDSQFSNGGENPTPELQKIANNIVSKNGTKLISKVSNSPNHKVAQQKIMGTVSNAIPKLNSNQKGQIKAGDVAKAVSTNLGTNLMDKN